MAENPISLNSNQATLGLNLDSVVNQLQVGQLTYCLNGGVSSFDGSEITYSNDQANIECIQFPEGYKVIGIKNITQINKVMYWLTNPSTGFSQVGYTDNDSCIYNILLDDTFAGSDLLNFNIFNCIHKVEVKTTNCSTQVYWTDKLNPRRFLDLNNLPWKDVLIAGVYVPTIGNIDTNKMLVQPHFSVPKIEASEENIGGNLPEGTYQFAIQYSDIFSNGYTSYYSVTNPVRIFLDGKLSNNYNEITNHAISINIDNLDTTGLYDYFNLAVIKTINEIASVDLVGTFYIQRQSFQHTYTGLEQSKANIKLTIEDVFEKTNYYDLAGTLTQVDNVLVWGDLVKEDNLSYQKIANQINVNWGTWQIPDNKSVNYDNGVTCANIQGFMRDEVYPLEIAYVHKNGKISDRFHIPGRTANAFDLQIIPNSNPDVVGTSTTLCAGPTNSPARWKVYNTGSVLGTEPTFNPLDSCNPQPYQFGQMSYWESQEVYPNNSFIWGALANQPIRHHKFPDSLITHIHDENPFALGTNDYNNYEHKLYPIGIKVDINQIRQLIQDSPDLSQAQKDDIVGFRIMRGDRVNNKTVIAKGLLYNCGKYTKETSTYYYPNYPFNDVNPDSFISSAIVNDKSGDNASTRLNDFQRGRFTFHSPDTAFFHPSGIQGSFLKLETTEYGNCKSHFVPVKDNAREKLRTVKDLEIALAGGVASIVGLEGQFNFTTGSIATSEIGVSPSFHAENFFPSFNNVLEVIDKLIPWTNYGWQYNGVGYYGNYTTIANNGSKIRSIENGGYITTGLQGTFGDDFAINNTSRESSVYINTGDSSLLYAYENAGTVQDTSRVTAGEVGVCGTSSVFFRDIASYYASIKRYEPGQWGEIFSYGIVDTGKYYTFVDDNRNLITSIDTIFGGDIFINRFALKRKHAFFLKSTVNRPDGYDIDYDEQGNVGYPIWYYSTSNKIINVNNGPINTALTNFVNTLDNWVLNILLLGIPILLTGMALLLALIKDGLLTSLGIKVTNLQCPNGGVANNQGLYETGQAYLYAYGIPYFYAESEVNVDMRQATNIKEGDFYPNVSTDIPDDWLQETNVPIIWDNSYVYNRTYSKENKDNVYTTIRPDWTPNEPCFTYFPNSAIWSDKSSLEEIKNNWLVYRPANVNHFNKSYGKLIALDTLKQNQVLVRYENRAQIENVFTTVQVSAGPDAYLGNTKLFSNTPVDLSNTDTGAYGSQNKFVLRTEQGTIFVDAKRSQIALFQDTNIVDIAEKGMDKWFSEHLPFKILSTFPTVDVDNNFNGIGLHGTYDNFYKRFILTKLDYEPLDDNIRFDGTNFYLPINGTTTSSTTTTSGTLTCCPDGYTYLEGNKVCVNDMDQQTRPILCPDTVVITNNPNYEGKQIINLTDPLYFCNKSWTISFSFKTNSWTSWHSFIPNYYIAHENYFQTGLNSIESLWNHNVDYTQFNSYYGNIYPYILEYPFHYKINDEILQNVKDYTTVIKYQDQDNWTNVKENVFFNKAIIYNGDQCTGLLNLIPKDNSNLRLYNRYPINNIDSKDILVDRRDKFYQYNQFYNILIDPNVNIWENTCEYTMTNKELNVANLDYGLLSFKKDQIRGDYVILRHIKDNSNEFKMISRFILTPTVISYS